LDFKFVVFVFRERGLKIHQFKKVREKDCFNCQSTRVVRRKNLIVNVLKILFTLLQQERERN
jgi:hypothetical protein